MKLQKHHFSWIFTGAIIFILMLLYSTVLTFPAWSGYLTFGLLTLIMAWRAFAIVLQQGCSGFLKQTRSFAINYYGSFISLYE